MQISTRSSGENQLTISWRFGVIFTWFSFDYQLIISWAFSVGHPCIILCIFVYFCTFLYFSVILSKKRTKFTVMYRKVYKITEIHRNSEMYWKIHFLLPPGMYLGVMNFSCQSLIIRSWPDFGLTSATYG